MATSLVQTIPCVTTIAGSRVTVNAETWGSTGLGTITVAAASAVSVDLFVEGDIDGFLRFPFADPETMEGVLTPQELATTDIGLTQGGAGGTLGLIVEEVFAY